jgi:hypothetical protein
LEHNKALLGHVDELEVPWAARHSTGGNRQGSLSFRRLPLEAGKL